MALTKCTDCGREISSDAPACPNCGKPRATPKGGRTALWLTGVAIGIAVLAWRFMNMDPSEPECLGGTAKRFFIRTFESSQIAKLRNLTVVEVEDQKMIAAGPKPTDKVCEITFLLNNAEKASYTFRFKDGPQGGYLAEGTPNSFLFW